MQDQQVIIDTGVSSVLPNGGTSQTLPSQQHTTLSLDDTHFLDTLHTLYHHRLSHLQPLLSALSSERERAVHRAQEWAAVRQRVSRQRQAAVQAIRLRHHELVLRLDARMERAVEEVRAEEGRRGQEG